MQELPDTPNWLLNKAHQFFYSDRVKAAKYLCWLNFLLNPRDYFAICWYANCLYLTSTNSDRSACLLYQRAIQICPEHPLAHVGLGRIHYFNAIQIMRGYSIFPGGSSMMFMDEADPAALEDQSSFRIPGFANSQCGNRKIAIKELEEAAQLVYDEEYEADLLCMAAEMRGHIDSQGGIKAFQKVLNIDPDHVSARANLALVYAAEGESTLALNEYRFLTYCDREAAESLRSSLKRHGIETQ